jgi:hypothetical protein
MRWRTYPRDLIHLIRPASDVKRTSAALSSPGKAPGAAGGALASEADRFYALLREPSA